jgi:pimeloyl-ACP methyl ester carboxylesterase
VATQVEKAGDTRAPLDNKATLSRWFGTDPQGIEKDAAAACDHWLREADPTGYSDAYQVFAHSDAPDDAVLRTLSVPALVATGNEDPNSSPSMTRAVAALLPDAQHLIVDKARHMMPMTHSTELAHALLRRFSTSPSV